MPIERYRRGSGITKKQRIRVTKRIRVPEKAVMRKMLRRDFTFEGLYGAALEAQTRGILEAAGITADQEKLPDGSEVSGWAAVVRQRGYEEDSEQDFAARLLDKLGLLRAMIARRQAEETARFAFELGATAKEAETKFLWESHALRGLRRAQIQEERAKQFRRSNSARTEIAAAQAATWQKEADAAWERNPHLSAADVAVLIARKLGGNPNTIRRKIRLSDQKTQKVVTDP